MVGPLFLSLKLLGKLRVPEEVELKGKTMIGIFTTSVKHGTLFLLSGLDLKKHGEAAYPTEAYGHGWPEPEFLNGIATSPAGLDTFTKAAKPTQLNGTLYLTPFTAPNGRIF